MSETDKSFSDLRTSVEGKIPSELLFSPEGDRLLEILVKIEENLFDDKGTVSAGEKEAPYLVKKFSNLVRQLLEISRGLEIDAGEIWGEMVSSKVIGEEPKQKLTDLGFSEGVEFEEIRDVLSEFESTSHTIVFNLIRQGYLSVEDLESLGFGKNDLDKMRSMITSKQGQELTDWINGKEEGGKHIEERFSSLAKLKRLIEEDFPDEEHYKPKILEDLRSMLEESLKETEKVGGFRKDYLVKNYFSLAEEKINGLMLLQEAYDRGQAADKAFKDRKKSLKKLEEYLEKVPDGSKKILEIRDDWGTSSFQELATELDKLERDIRGEYTRLGRSDLLDPMKDNLPGSAATNDFLKKIQKNYDYLIDELKKFINLAENPPVDQMSLHEIVSEMGKKGWDPFLWHEQKFQQTGRMKDLIRSFLDRAMSPVEEAEKNHEKELERIVEKVRMQLWAWDNKGIYEPGAASVDISMFEQEGINQRQFVRSEFLTATTYHPEWGEDVREILKDTIITAGLRENEIFISRNVGGKEEEMILYFDNIHDPNERKKKLLKGDKILYTHDPNLFYPWLAEENGRPSLEKRLDQKFGEKSKNPKHEKAIEMARLLFTSFDMLTVSLMQLQRKTQTRAHNGGLDMVDLIMLFDPLAAYVHRSERYGFVVSDWVGWWLYFLKNIDPDSPDWGRDVGSDEIYKERAADFLVEKQKEIKLQQRAFYDRPELESEDGKRGPLREIDPLGPFESLFANPWQAMLLADGEVLELPDGTCVTNEGSIDPEKIKPGEKISDEYRDGGGVIEVPDGGELDLPKPLESSKTKLASFRLWMVAKAGWEEMLEITFKGIQNDASIEFLLEEEKEGGKGGLISRFIGGGAGRAKMFPGQHLEKMLGPMLLHLIRRTFQVYKGRGKVAETRLFREIMEGLDASKAGGLSHFKDIITAVEQELIGDKEHYDSMSSTLKKRENGHRQKETMQWMDHYHRHELKEEPPRSVAGYVPNFDSLDSDDRNYLLVQRNSPFGTIPSPLTRKGTMHHLKEEKH